MASKLEQASPRRTADDVLLTGIQSMDAIHLRYQVRGMKRVFRPGGSFEAKHRRYGLHLWYQVSVDSTVSTASVVSAYRSLPGINISEPVYKKTSNLLNENLLQDSIPNSGPGTLPRATNDLLFPRQWHFNNTGDYTHPPGIDIDLLCAWELATGNSNIVVAVVDGGIQTTHPDLAANMWRNPKEIPLNKIDDDGNGYIDDFHGYNFAYDRGPIDPSYHGTHVAGILAATTNNGIGLAGVAGGSGAGDGARLMSCAVFSESGASGGLAEAYVYSADHGAIISQNSWGYWQPNVIEQVVLDGIDYFIAEAGRNESGHQVAAMNGGIVVFAAGNGNSFDAWYPAFYEPTVAVAATTRSDEKASYSNYGEWIDIAAPGGDGEQYWNEWIYSTVPANNYNYLRGTSMACPQVSGVAALIISKFGGPGFTPDMLREKLFNGAESIEEKNPTFQGMLGSGRLNAYGALISNKGISPDRINDLRAVKVSQDSVTLQWTTPGDADAGTAYRYELHWASYPLTAENIFQLGSTIPIPVRKIKGMSDTLVVSSLSGQQTYYFAMVSYDFYGNMSQISNVVEQTTGPAAYIYLPQNFILSKVKTGQTTAYPFTIINFGNLPLEFKFIKRDSGNFSSLSLSEGVVPPNDTLAITVTLRSHNLWAGEYFQGYDIENNGSSFNNPYPFQIYMIVTDIGIPVVSLASEVIDFQNGYIGTPKVKTLTIHNDGTEPLMITSVTSEDPVFTTSFKETINIAPFKDGIVNVTFKASEERIYDNSLIVHSNDPVRPTTHVRMLGSGVLPPDIEVTPASVQASLNTGRKTSMPLVIKNTGFTDLEFSTEVIQHNADTPLVHRVLILTPDRNPEILTQSFKGDDQIETEIYPRDSIHTIKLQHLVPYDVVFVNNRYDWGGLGVRGSPTTIGNVLAQYIDQGGKVIVNQFVHYGPTGNEEPVGLKGRFLEEQYSPFGLSIDIGCQPCLMDTILIQDHPLVKGISKLESYSWGYKVKLTPGAVEIARWSDGLPFVAVKPGVVAVNAFIYEGIPTTSELSLLYQNAVRWLRSSYISVVPPRGSIAAGQQKSVDIQLDMTGMNIRKRYERTLVIHNNVPLKEHIAVPITVDALGPVLTLSPDTVIAILDSVRTGNRTLMLHNNSMAAVSFSIRMDSVDYMQIQPASGTIAALDSIPLALSLDVLHLAFGEYSNHITFSVDGRDELTVPIYLSVTDDPEIKVDPLELQASLGYREDTVQYFNIVNTGGESLTYTIDVSGAGTSNSGVGARVKVLETNFESPLFPPPGWEIVDNAGYGEIWDLSSKHDGNFVSTGEAASVKQRSSELGTDTELRSPQLYVQAYEQIVLQFKVNHQGGQLDLDILLDGKLPWKNILHWSQSFGPYYQSPGMFVRVALDSLLTGANSFQLRWRKYYLAEDYLSDYSQIDDVLIEADPVEWLAVQPSDGLIAVGDTAKIAAMFYAEDIEAQSYEATVNIRSNAENDPLIKLPVSIQVLKPAILLLRPDSMYQTLQQGDSAIQVLNISNAGESPLRFAFDEVLVPTSVSTARKERRISISRTNTSSRTPPMMDDVYAIPHPVSRQRVQSSSSSTQLYATGFEEFYPGELDLQEGWYSDPGVWSIESGSPFNGLQHMRGVSDTLGYAVAFSPYIFLEEPWPDMSSVSMQINLDSAAGGQWQVVPASPTIGFVTTRIDFTPEGTMRALVQDSLDIYNAYFVDVPAILPKGYFELRVDVSSTKAQFMVYINNEKVFTGACIANIIEEVAFIINTKIPSLKIDVDNLRHYIGVPPVTWIKAEPTSGVIPAGESLPVNIHFNTSELGNGTFHHKLTFNTNDPEQRKAFMPATLRVTAQGENNLPVIEPLQDTSVVQTEELILRFSATTPSDNVITMDVPDPPSFAKKVESGNGYVIYQFNPTLTDEARAYDITVTANDAQENSSSTSFRLTVLPYGIRNFSLVDLGTGNTLLDFDDSLTLDVGGESFRQLAIRANTRPQKVGSVLFRIDGGKKHVENRVPYLLAGSQLWHLSAGFHLLTAETYTKHSGQGDVQQYKDAVISVVNSVSVIGFEVINAYGDRIQNLKDGDVLNVKDPRYKHMNIQALLTEQAPNGSVTFHLNEVPYRVENHPPYIMAVNKRKWWTNSGSYTVQATPFSKKNGRGVPGKSLAVTFSIIADEPEPGKTLAARQQSQAEKVTGEWISAYPVPSDRFIHLSIYEDVANLRVQVVIRGIQSQVLFNQVMVFNGGVCTLDLEKIGLSDGVYYLQLRTSAMNRTIKFIKE